MPSPYISWLEAGADARESIGGKGASLATMLAAGFPVPPGFVVTVDAYRRFLAANDIGPWDLDADSLSDVAAAARLSERVCGELSRCSLPDELRLAILESLSTLASRVSNEVYAVRSSAVSEDSAQASFAGLYETYLNARDAESVLRYVHACFVSLWSSRAIHYRALKELDQGREAMAVVVMELVLSDSAGVAFTVNPVTGDSSQVVINATWGLGEAVVQGIVTPDMFVIDKPSLALVSREIHSKDVAIVPDPDGRPETIEVTIDEPRASEPSLSDEQAVAVARMARDAEEYYGCPQDIEWAISKGSLYLLQARPVTTL
ncbi:MAG: PEP/pyruvate-binding domain-containing protein [Dehalococcoidia bacterium]